MERPVEIGVFHRKQSGFLGFRRRQSMGWASEVVDRLRHAPEHEADAHADAEHHGDPGRRPKLWLLIVAAEPALAESADGPERSEDRRVGKECVSPCQAPWAPS